MGSQDFSYTGLSQTFTVPAGVTALTVAAFGAAGGGTYGGAGARVTGTFPVTPGQVLTIKVGEQPGGNAGGWPNGGAGGSAGSGGSGWGGGGRTEIKDAYQGILYAIAAGGGGQAGGANSDYGGGGQSGAKGYRGFAGSVTGGDPGTSSGGGSGGGPGGSWGGFNQGGTGGSFGGASRAGGGGGDGYYGGGGGGYYASTQPAGGGGGGSSYTFGGVLTLTDGYNFGSTGFLTLSWTDPIILTRSGVITVSPSMSATRVSRMIRVGSLAVATALSAVSIMVETARAVAIHQGGAMTPEKPTMLRIAGVWAQKAHKIRSGGVFK